MINYVSVGVNDIEAAATFYDAVFSTLQYKQHAKFDNVIAYGKEHIDFLAVLQNGEQLLLKNDQIHIAFTADNIQQVDNFHNIAIVYKGKSEGVPITRDYPQGEVYSTYIRDPFGNKLEAIFKEG
ncbi:MAG: VOC family protein [Cellvibrionaceae bacterium]